MKKSSKIPIVEDQMAPTPRMDSEEEYKYREQKLPSTTQATPLSAATREKNTKKLQELVKQRRRGHYKGNKYDLPQPTHQCNIRVQETRVEPTSQHVVVLETNMHVHHQANFVIDPKTGASL